MSKNQFFCSLFGIIYAFFLNLQIMELMANHTFYMLLIVLAFMIFNTVYFIRNFKIRKYIINGVVLEMAIGIIFFMMFFIVCGTFFPKDNVWF